MNTTFIEMSLAVPTATPMPKTLLLPDPSSLLQSMESDAIPDFFLEAANVDFTALVSAEGLERLLGDKPMGRTAFKSGACPMGGSQQVITCWIQGFLLEMPSACPQRCAGGIMQWALLALRNKCSNEELWRVPPILEAFDRSLAGHLRGWMASDGEFGRRISRLELAILGCGKVLPSRKLLSMVAHRITRAPGQEESLILLGWESLVSRGPSIQDAATFFDDLSAFLDAMPPNLISPPQVTMRVVRELRKCTDRAIQADMAAFASLHAHDPQKRWEFLPSIIQRI